jgi:putative ABC transport system ATP-binding protein
MPPILGIAGLRVALADADRRFALVIDRLDLAAGDIWGLTGQSGTGKTLLLELLGLMRRPAPGGDFVLGEAGTGAEDRSHDIAALWRGPSGVARAAELRGRLIGFIPQTGGLLPFLTLAENVALTQRISGRIDADWRAHLLDRLGLSAYARLMPGALSIGQRQRAAIARALAHRPPLVLADEPTAALDPDTAAEAMRLLIGMAGEGGAAILVSSHDVALLDRFPMRRLRLEAREIAPGTVESRLMGAEESVG